ncbi:hypothetical protein BpHYR1_008224, partial [Brachionus plicatilis]
KLRTISNLRREECRFLTTKEINLTNSDFLLSTRQMCTKGRVHMRKNGLELPNLESFSSIESDGESSHSRDEY